MGEELGWFEGLAIAGFSLLGLVAWLLLLGFGCALLSAVVVAFAFALVLAAYALASLDCGLAFSLAKNFMLCL